MQTKGAFAAFATQVLKGNEGVFLSHRTTKGEEDWYAGWGQPKAANFSKGPFPLFCVSDFLGQNTRILHFPNSSDTQQPQGLKAEPFPEELKNIFLPEDWKTNETEESFCQKVAATQAAARAGELWVLNLAHQPQGTLKDERVLLAAFWRFLQAKKPHMGGIWWTKDLKFCSFSPEIFLLQDGNQLQTFPIKGTGGQGLEKDEKEIAELYMVTDLLRNDLSQICHPVTVPAERVLTDQQDFLHTHAHICGTLLRDTFTQEQYEKLLPAGSVTGAPKHRVVQKILELETADREFYTGTFGVRTGPDHGRFAILIRTLFAKEEQWQFPVGAGITVESDPMAEWQETKVKMADFIRFATNSGV